MNTVPTVYSRADALSEMIESMSGVKQPTSRHNDGGGAINVDVVIEIPRGSFLKRGGDGNIDFVSPLPCPYNYGSIHQYIGGEGDYLDAVVLGPRLAIGTRVQVQAQGAIGMSERYMYDDKLICSKSPVTAAQRRRLLGFFHFYAFSKGILNILRGQRGASRCEGWGDAQAAIRRAVPIRQGRQQPKIRF